MARRVVRWLSIALCLQICFAASASAAWDPDRYRDLETLQFLTVGPEEGEHWSTVWLVVIDGQVYIRLGSRAAERIERNEKKPLVRVKIGGEEFRNVRAEPAPEMAERVADAMADKYWSDFLVRFLPHPLTMRLVPDVQTTRSGGATRATRA
jgi:hypothetical protein